MWVFCPCIESAVVYPMCLLFTRAHDTPPPPRMYHALLLFSKSVRVRAHMCVCMCACVRMCVINNISIPSCSWHRTCAAVHE